MPENFIILDKKEMKSRFIHETKSPKISRVIKLNNDVAKG